MPPKASAKSQPKVVYPSGVKEITDDLGTDELVRRLKACAQAFQNMGQDDNNQDFIPLAMHLAQDTFLEHGNKDVRLLIACCIADVFRVYAPDAPYKDPEHLKNIFLFFIQQLRGLEDPKDPAFKRYFYLLENLAWVKSFNICIELEENQTIFYQLFRLMFTIVNDDHSVKVKNFMLDMMAPLISEADSVSHELLEVILSNIIEPRKSQNRNAYSLARDLLKKTSSTIEPYIQGYFNNALILGKTSESEISNHLYDLIYELNSISPSVLLAVLPQLEFKLKSNDEKERLEVTRLLARMFSDKDSELAVRHKSLWSCFLGRFNDISVGVRNRCVQYSMHFLLNHPELRADITEQLKQRQHDPEESVRYEVVMAIISGAKKDFSSISDDLLDFVKERTLDKKFKIRKEALVGLSMIYKRCMNNPEIPESTRECVSWIKNKVLHVYYQTALEDRLLVERILHTCLVPYLLPPEDRMMKLYQLYATVDDHAVKAFNELLKCQSSVRNNVRSLLEAHTEEKSEENDKQIMQKIFVLAKALPDPVKAQEFLKKFSNMLQTDGRIRNYLQVILQPDCLCQEAEHNVRELLKKLGNPVMTNVFYMTVKQLLERVAPVLIDKLAVQALLGYVEKAEKNTDNFIEEVGSPKAPERGFRLLHALSLVFPGSFDSPAVYDKLIEFLNCGVDILDEITLQIIHAIGENVEAKYPDIVEKLVPILLTFIKEGTAKQAKHAVRCMDQITSKKEEHFGDILEDLKKNLSLDSPNFCTTLISIGHIAVRCQGPFSSQMKTIAKTIVKDLIMQDKYSVSESSSDFYDEKFLTDETRAKIEGMKMIVRWLLGIKSNQASVTSSLRLFTSVVEHDGDLMNRNLISKPEKSWLRMIAGCCILKIAQEPAFVDALTTEHFQVVAKLIMDQTMEVRERFAQKLHKGLISLRLPLEFMAIFALGANEVDRDRKNTLKQYLLANINKRRDYLKQNALSSSKLLLYLPDYVLPYAIHLLVHLPDFKKYDQVDVLNNIKDCLWFLMEPLIIKNENYSFGFFKKLLENIKQTRVKQSVDNEMQNMKLYAVCDLALGLVMSKTANFVLKEHPVEPTLPSKLYTDIDTSFQNTKIYLPAELALMFPKGVCLDSEYQKKAGAVGPGQKRPRQGKGANGPWRGRKQTNGDSEGSHQEDDEGSFGEGEAAAKRMRDMLHGGDPNIVVIPMDEGAQETGIHEVIEVATTIPTILSDQGENSTLGTRTDEEMEREIQAVIDDDGTITIVKHVEVELLQKMQAGGITIIQQQEEQQPQREEEEEEEGVATTETAKPAEVEKEPSEGQSVEPVTETVIVVPTPPKETVSKRKPKLIPKKEYDEEELQAAKDIGFIEDDTPVEDEPTKKRRASQPSKGEPAPSKRLRSAGPVADKTKEDEKAPSSKTTRSSKVQASDAKQDSSPASSPASSSRPTRQGTRKLVSKADETSTKDASKKVEPQKPGEKSPTPAKAGTSSKATTETSVPPRRNLRRSSGVINGASRTANSDDEGQDSSPRKSTRVQTRNVQKSKDATSSQNVKTKVTRKLR